MSNCELALHYEVKKTSGTWRDVCKYEPCPESREILYGHISNPLLDTMNKKENGKAKGFMGPGEKSMG